MKKNFPVTGNEVDYSSDLQMISTTNMKGILTYANEDFIEDSGYDNDELLGVSHNIVRHPDMPPAAFANLWETLKAGKAWMGMVKNRCKNGDHYWVSAFVTPIYEGGRITGYQSVRSKPSRKVVDRADKFYKNVNDERRAWMLRLRQKLTCGPCLLLFSGLASALLVGALAMLLGVGWLEAAELSGIAAVAGVLQSVILRRPLARLVKETRKIVENPLLQQVYTGRSDEIGKLEFVIQLLQAKLVTVSGRITDAAEHIGRVAERSEGIVEQTEQGVIKQQVEIDQVATAMNEMSATVQEVAKNAAHSADATGATDREARQGREILSKTIQAIDSVADEINRTAGVIEELRDSSEEIGKVIDVIRGIAEQTNLLALNAAIEAARAGEQGRGYAVVADEVRTLASRTQEFTSEIQKMIEKLQAMSNEAVKAMQQSNDQAHQSVEGAAEARQALDAIITAIDETTGMSNQIATTSEEQSSVAEEINRNINNISQVAVETADSANQSGQANDELISLVRGFDSMVRQFGIN